MQSAPNMVTHKTTEHVIPAVSARLLQLKPDQTLHVTRAPMDADGYTLCRIVHSVQP